MSDLIQLKVRLVDKKVFKKFSFYPKKTVKEARLFIAAELEVDPEQYGLFLPPKDDQNGVWFRDDYPLDFYGLEGENEKEALLFTSKDNPQMEFVEFKKRYRPIKVAKGDNQFRTLMVDDTMNVADIVKYVSTQVPISSAIDEDQTVTNIYEMEVLSNDMTIREQGYVGECTTNLSRSAKGELNLCVQVPYFEGFIMRKRGGGLIKGLKNWNKRWYSLRKNKLLYYKSKSDTNEMGCILMKTVQTVRPAREVAEIPSKYLKMCFEIVTPARTFVMLASNVNEMKKWVEILDSSRRMFAYETHFFGVASKKISEGGSAINGDDSDDEIAEEEKLQKAKRLQEQKLEKERQEQEKQAAAEKERKEEQEHQERIRLEQEQQERLFIEQELIRAEEERKERIRLEQEEQERQEQERRRIEEEEMIKLMIEEEERRRKLEEKRQEDLRKIQEEQELLERQQQEFIAKQQQLELEKQRQLQDQLEEDRRLEELMLQMEMDQEERIKVKEEQERQEQEKLEQAKLLAQEEERIREEQERIRIEQERVIKERQEEERRMEEERQEEKRIEAERQEKLRIEKEERERREEEEKKEKERKRQEEEQRIKLEQEEKLRLFEEEKKKQQEEEKRKQEEERIRVAEQIRKQRLEEEERERVEQLRLEEEERERERQQQQQQQDESNDENVDMLDEFEREEEEREKEQLASKRLRSLQARLESVCAETPELKLLLSESILTTPENLLLSWANYIVSGISSPSLHSSSRSQIPGADSLSYSSSSSSSHQNATLLSGGQGSGDDSSNIDGNGSNGSGTGATGGRILKPSTASVTLVPSTASIGANAMGGGSGIGDLSRATFLSSTHLVSTQAVSHVQLKDLKSLDANLEMYASLLFKLEPQEFDLQHYVSLSTNAEKAQYIHATLVKLGVTTVSVEQLLSNESDSHLNILLTIYEEVGGEQWKEEFHTQVVSKRSFATKYISQLLSNSIGLTIAQSPLDLLPTLMSGRVLCELINKVYPGTIDERVIIKTDQFCKNNLMLAANATKALGGQQIPDIEYLSENGNHVSTTILHNLTWAIVETCLLQSADPSKNRHLFHLLRAETRTSFMKLEKEKIMLRWFNYHLRKGSNRSINNFTDDLEDCENYAYLFAVIAPQHSLKAEILKESDWEKRAEMVLSMAAKIGCMSLLSPRDIVETENSQLNQLFVADIMRVAHGLPAYQFRLDVEQLDDQVQKSKDQGNNDTELLQWVNGLGIEGVEAKHLLDDFKSGYLFLKIFEKVTPAGTLDPKKFRTNPTSVFKMVELCNYTMEICHKFKLNVAGTAGTDLANGDIRSNRAILNQIRRVIIGEKTTVDSVISNQSVALKWANSKIGVDVKVKSIQSFKDQFLQDGLFLLELLSSIENNSVDRKYINTVCSTEEQQESNCRYFLSCAWASGIPLNVVWEDVQKVRSKSIKHIIETLQSWDLLKLNQQQQLSNNNNNTTTTTTATTTTTTSNI